MSQKKEELEKQLNCTKNEVTQLDENNYVLEELLEETHRKNELVIESLVEKDMEISNLRSEVDELRCENQSMCKKIQSMDNTLVCKNMNEYKVYIDVETKHKCLFRQGIYFQFFFMENVFNTRR